MRLIDVDVFDAIINDDGTIDVYATETARNAMLIMPTVDAVPVVRCKDCKHYERDHFDAVYYPTESGEAQKVPLITAHNICTKWGDGCKTAEDGYCFLGERKEE